MSYRNLPPREVPDLLGQHDVVVLDLRDAESFSKGHIRGARLSGDAVLSELMHRRRQDPPVLVYCYRGNSSRALCELLAAVGFTRVFNLDGGWAAWERRQRPSATVAPEPVRAWAARHGFDLDELNGRIDNGMSMLMVAAMQARQDIVGWLLEAGADANLLNDDENNALWFACYSGQPELVDLLIAHRCDMDNRNVNGATCLIYAASAGKFDVVKALVDAGADLSSTTRDGFSALDSASTVPVLRYLRRRYAAA
ncbi:MAG: ankyrin repeat domain-containing protein [Gemmatimonadota bacterium]|jgi:rhodanese-related sulfurtransferase